MCKINANLFYTIRYNKIYVSKISEYTYEKCKGNNTTATLAHKYMSHFFCCHYGIYYLTAFISPRR